MTEHKPYTKVAVIGAGVMGAGIAAHLANAGVQVLLFDQKKETAEKGIQKLHKTKPAPLMLPAFAKRITPLSTENDLAVLKECDWVIEAIVENAEIKRSLYAKVVPHLKKTAVLSSNTSTIPLDDLTKGLPVGVVKRVCITHFFNPPRYLRLLEFVAHPSAPEKTMARLQEFITHTMGKTVIPCKDTPGFIANRIGTFWLHCAVSEAIERGIPVHVADALLGRPMGVPKTGVFGLLDLVGLDVMPHILNSFFETLPQDDAFQAIGPIPALLTEMIESGHTGRKGLGGFYKLDKNRKKLVKDLHTGDYKPAQKVALPVLKQRDLRALLADESPEGRYAWSVFSQTMAYAASLSKEIAYTPADIDTAMKLGYNWKYGPFALIEKVGAEWFKEKLGKDIKIPAVKQKATGGIPKTKKIWSNASASVWDVGQKVAVLEFHSKMNSLDPLILRMINRCVKHLPKRGFKGLVIYNDGTQFSVGANLGMLLVGTLPVVRHLGATWAINWLLSYGQQAFQNLKYAPFPVVGAPSGMALGGGCEVLLHCDAVVAHAESYVGLVEGGVGIVPGWGGCKEMLGRLAANPKAPKGPMPAVVQAFQTIGTAQVATSAFEAQKLGFFKPTDEIVFNRDHLLNAATRKVLNLAKEYTPPEPFTYTLPGASGAAAIKMALNDFANKGLATPHDRTVGESLATVLSGDKTDMTETLTEHDILKLERKAIRQLCRTEGTRARIRHLIKTGKPLRN